MSEGRSFTGRRTRHRTRWGVRAADRISSIVITVGGIGTIVAVSLVFVVLVAVVWPLFTSAKIVDPVRSAASNSTPLHTEIDEYQLLGWSVHRSGDLFVFRLDTGETILQRKLFETEASVTAIATTASDNDVAIGFSDGSLRVGKIHFTTTFVDGAVEHLVDMEPNERRTDGEGLVQLTPQGQYRRQTIAIEFGDAIQLADQSVEDLDRSPLTGSVVFILKDGSVHHASISQSENMLSGEVETAVQRSKIPIAAHGNIAPRYAKLVGRGDSIYVIWEDGWLQRFDSRDKSNISLTERFDLLGGNAARRISTVAMAIGRESLLVGDSEGYVTAWSEARTAVSESNDSKWLLPIHELAARPSAVTALGVSRRSRMLAAGYQDGQIRVFHVTTNQLLAETSFDQGQAIRHLSIAPKDDGLFALAGQNYWTSKFDPAYPEATWNSLFRPIWYEGFPRPELIWQSSSANVESEMKLSLLPLIFGTIKATLYSMLFGAPLALLAAIYTSEFTHPRIRSVMKSLIEMMASLPSVVLGFIAAVVVAPFIEGFVSQTLCMFLTVPFAVLLGAFLWQQIPHRLSLRMTSLRLPSVAVSIVGGVYAGLQLGPLAEGHFFDGNIFYWLDGQGNATGAWMIMLLPLSGVLMGVAVVLWINPWLRGLSLGWSRTQFNAVNLVKFLVATAVAFLAAWLVSRSLVAFGLDPRGSVISTYDGRNALVVGFVMGFAIIPIIYTIAEDALSTVPSHLRSASLGAGATPWQTAVRVVIPTAMSGLFSALMIGLGRAVGETMIVLMAAGNIPVMDWNVFNGFRTLSANIATELPEAVENSTHYRTLFLAALTLFVLTFFVNTIAEIVRLQFRKRAVRL